MEAKNENSETYKTCISACCIFLTAIAVIGGAISYLVFGIMYLVQDYDLANDCKGSNLWAYVLTAIILSLSRGNAKNMYDDDGNLSICTIIFMGLIELGLSIWGGIELFDKSCDDLHDSNIWRFGLATFVLQLFVASLILVIIPVITFLVIYFDKPTNNNQTSNNIQYSAPEDITSSKKDNGSPITTNEIVLNKV
jgi:hypothetical protein